MLLFYIICDMSCILPINKLIILKSVLKISAWIFVSIKDPFLYHKFCYLVFKLFLSYLGVWGWVVWVIHFLLPLWVQILPETLDYFKWGSYPVRLQNIGGSTHLSACAWNKAWKGTPRSFSTNASWKSHHNNDINSVDDVI